MTPQDFCFWLQGFVELTRDTKPDHAQWKMIKEHLALVFDKQTPELSPKPSEAKPQVDESQDHKAKPSIAKELEDLLKDLSLPDVKPIDVWPYSSPYDRFEGDRYWKPDVTC